MVGCVSSICCGLCLYCVDGCIDVVGDICFVGYLFLLFVGVRGLLLVLCISCFKSLGSVGVGLVYACVRFVVLCICIGRVLIGGG